MWMGQIAEYKKETKKSLAVWLITLRLKNSMPSEFLGVGGMPRSHYMLSVGLTSKEVVSVYHNTNSADCIVLPHWIYEAGTLMWHPTLSHYDS